MIKNKYLSKLLAGLSLFLLIGCGQSLDATAVAKPTQTTSAGNASAIQTVAQSYGSSQALQQGLIVQLDPKNSANVTQSTYADAKKMLGVVVAANAAPVSLSTGATGQQTYVVTSGRYTVLVSNQDGAINSGDYVSISAIDGIGMKADTSEPFILGRAITGFDGHTNVISQTTLKTSAGKQLNTAIGTITVNVGITKNPLVVTGSSGVPQVIQKLAVSLVGKPISAPQLYLSALVLLAGLALVVSLLYSGVQNGMLAIGRNPLAHKSIMRNMIQVIVTGVLIFLGCLVAVYLILKL